MTYLAHTESQDRSNVQTFVLSTSKVVAYLQCPRQFYFKYFFHLPTKTSQRQLFGLWMHDCFERQMLGLELSPPPTRLSSKWVDKGRCLVDEARKMNLTHKQFNVRDVERWFAVRLNSFYVVGRVDLVVERAGHPYVVDLKFSSNVEYLNSPFVLLQLRIYAWAYFKLFGVVPGTGLIVGNPEDCSVQFRDLGIPIEQLEYAVKTLKKVANGIERRLFPRLPGKVCYRCSYRQWCESVAFLPKGSFLRKPRLTGERWVGGFDGKVEGK